MDHLHKKMLEHISEIEAHLHLIRAMTKTDADVQQYVGYQLAKTAAKLDTNMHLFITDTRHYSDEQPLANELLNEMNL